MSVSYKYLLTVLISIIVLDLMGQQEPQFTQNMFNHMGVNPGFAGLSNAISVTGFSRQQWVGFKDSEGNRVSPETYLISIDATVPRLRGGIGGSVMQDKIGFYTINDVQLGYSYHRRKGDSRLGIGLQVNFINTTLDAGKFIPVDETDPILSNLGGSEVSNMMFDLNVGLFYTIPGQYYISFSSTRLLESSKGFAESGGAYVNFRRHYYLTAGYHLPLPNNENIELIPSFMIKSDGASLQYDFNALAVFNKGFWGGMTYRHQDAIALMVGVGYNDFRIGYAYDIPLSVVGATGSHEIMINYLFKLELEQVRKSFRNTRFL